MSQHFADWDDRTLDLALEAFTHGVDDAQFQELEGRASREDLTAFEQTIAAIHWAHVSPLQAVPSGLKARLEAQAVQWSGASTESAKMVSETPRSTYAVDPSVSKAERPSAVKPIQRAQTPWGAIAGWAAAAALLVVLATKRSSAGTPSVPERMQMLLAQAPDLKRIEWSATEDPLAQGATGEVVWSDAQQEGYMVFHGLAPNNPAEHQYQLWIFDPTRVEWEAMPVDGGVFDVNALGEAVVPIQAKLPVRSAALFAITLEEPGGVVVSKREHLLLTAAVPS